MSELSDDEKAEACVEAFKPFADAERSVQEKMKKPDDGGSAFPFPQGGTSFTGEDGFTNHQFPGSDGMTLRVWLAARAPRDELDIGDTAKWCAEKLGITVEEYAKGGMSLYLKLVAKARYQWADAMIEARKR